MPEVSLRLLWRNVRRYRCNAAALHDLCQPIYFIIRHIAGLITERQTRRSEVFAHFQRTFAEDAGDGVADADAFRVARLAGLFGAALVGAEVGVVFLELVDQAGAFRNRRGRDFGLQLFLARSHPAQCGRVRAEVVGI